MTSYSIYVGLIKVNIFQQVQKWGFIAMDGSDLVATGGNFNSREDAELRARAIVSQLNSVEP